MAEVVEAIIEETIEEEPMEVNPVEETTPEVASAPPQPERKQRKPRAKAPPPSPIEAPAAPVAPTHRPRGRPAGSRNKVPDAPPLPPSADDIANRMLDIIAERQSGRRHAQKQLYESWLQ